MDKFEASSGLGPYELPESTENEVDRLLSLSPDVIKRMSANECAEAAYILEQFSFHLQRGINRQSSIVSWAESRIARIIAKRINEVQGYGAKERRMQAIYENDAAIETELLRAAAQMKVDRLNYLSQRVSALSVRMSELGFTKRVK